jgi:hypothetical protein
MLGGGHPRTLDAPGGAFNAKPLFASSLIKQAFEEVTEKWSLSIPGSRKGRPQRRRPALFPCTKSVLQSHTPSATANVRREKDGITVR